MRILLTVGHSKLKNGCITSADGTKLGGGNEYNFNKSFSKYVKKEIEKLGHTVDLVICPEGVFTKALQEKSYKLNKELQKKYDLVIELHLNASNNKKAEGTEVLYYSNTGKKYAESVQKQLAKVFIDRGAKRATNLYILKQTKAPAILIETFFCTNAAEWRYASTHKQKIAELIASGVNDCVK